MAAPIASCSGCQALRAEIAQLRAENAKLRSELDEVRRQQHRQAAPFRRRKERKAKPKNPGRPKGHAPALRPSEGQTLVDTDGLARLESVRQKLRRSNEHIPD